MENKIRHLEMIQSIITRMASNSCMLKGWAITLITGVFILSSKDSNSKFLFLAFIPTIFFWILDTYYLLQERNFRKLYDQVCKIKEDEITFLMNPQGKTDFGSFFKCMFSISELIFYVPLLATVAIVSIVVLFIK